MASFNKVILMGNLTRDPDLRFTGKGIAIAKIGLAMNRVWRTETGETKEEVTFVDIDAFGKQAETLGKYCKKGSPLLVEGRLRLDSWDDKQTGQKRSRLGVVLESFRFVGPASGARPEAAPDTTQRAAAPAPAQEPPPSVPPDMEAPPPEDDVPF